MIVLVVGDDDDVKVIFKEVLKGSFLVVFDVGKFKWVCELEVIGFL